MQLLTARASRAFRRYGENEKLLPKNGAQPAAIAFILQDFSTLVCIVLADMGSRGDCSKTALHYLKHDYMGGLNLT